MGKHAALIRDEAVYEGEAPNTLQIAKMAILDYMNLSDASPEDSPNAYNEGDTARYLSGVDYSEEGNDWMLDIDDRDSKGSNSDLHVLDNDKQTIPDTEHLSRSRVLPAPYTK